MDRQWIVNGAPDLVIGKVFHQSIAINGSDNVKMISVIGPRTRLRCNYRQAGKTVVVSSRNGRTPRIVGVKMRQLGAQDCRLQRIEARIVTPISCVLRASSQPY